MKNSFCVYVLKPNGSNKIYIGSTQDIDKRISRHYNELRNGKHHNVLFQKVWNECNNDTMNISIIECSSIESARTLEDNLIKKFIKTGILLNINNSSTGGDTKSFHPNRSEIINKTQQTSSLNASKMTEDEKILRWSRPGDKNGMFGKTHSQQVREIISKANKGKISKLRGIPKSEEAKLKMSEHAKTRIGSKNPFFGRKHSDEYKKRSSLFRLGKPNLACSKPVSINGVNYTSVQTAAKILNIPSITLRHRTISKNKKFIDYYYLN